MENSPQLRHAEAEALEQRGKAEGLEAEIAALRADAAESRKVLNTVSTIQAKAQKELEAEVKAAKELSAGYKPSKGDEAGMTPIGGGASTMKRMLRRV